jgi:hypothetical protein
LTFLIHMYTNNKTQMYFSVNQMTSRSM